jgi:membrane fusion protein, multidrug efflux system
MRSIVIPRGAIVPLPHVQLQVARRTMLLLAVTIGVALGGGWYGYDWWTLGRFIESTDDAYAGGNVTAIAPHVAGFISQIEVTDNQRVHNGQVLIRLDNRDYAAALDHARAVAAGRLAALKSLEAKYVLQQAAIRQAEADLTGKAAHATFAGEDALRYRNLALTSYGTRQNAERASALDEEARSATKSAQAGLAAARQQLSVLDAEIDEARAAVAQSRADLETARLNLGYTEIRSPIDGYVGNRAAQVGAYVASGAYLLSIIPAHGLWIDANFKEDQLAQIAPGQRATVTADLLAGRLFHGRVQSLAPGTGAIFSVIPPENATGNFTKIVQRVPVRIVLDDNDARRRELRPGLSMTVRVDTRPAGRAGE